MSQTELHEIETCTALDEPAFYYPWHAIARVSVKPIWQISLRLLPGMLHTMASSCMLVSSTARLSARPRIFRTAGQETGKVATQGSMRHDWSIPMTAACNQLMGLHTRDDRQNVYCNATRLLIQTTDGSAQPMDEVAYAGRPSEPSLQCAIAGKHNQGGLSAIVSTWMHVASHWATIAIKMET